MDRDKEILPFSTRGQIVAPSAIVAKWVTAIAAGGPATQDAATITNPDDEITDSTRRVLGKAYSGTLLALCLAYDDELGGITDPVVKVFGRYGKGHRWEPVPNIKNRLAVQLATDPTQDAADGTLKYTTVDPDANVWDVGAFGELLVGVETALAGTGSTSNAIIQARLWG